MGPWQSVAWYLTTRHFVKRHARDPEEVPATIELDRLRVKPTVKITGEFYLQTVEGDPNYNIHRWLEAEGAEVYPAGITVWMDYLLRLGLQKFEDYSGVERGARLSSGLGRAVQAIYRGAFDRLRRPWAILPTSCRRQLELRRLAAPYFHSRLDGGEGDMLIGKAHLGPHQEEGPHDLRAVALFLHAEHHEHRGHVGRCSASIPDLPTPRCEIKGDAEVHALSRCQMILTEAKKRAQREFDEASRSGMTLDAIARLSRRAPDDEAGRLQGAAHGLRGGRRPTWSSTCAAKAR